MTRQPIASPGHRIRIARIARSLEQADLARVLGVSRTRVGQMEHDRPAANERMLRRIDVALGGALKAAAAFLEAIK